jgi:hypothetical protein
MFGAVLVAAGIGLYSLATAGLDMLMLQRTPGLVDNERMFTRRV